MTREEAIAELNKAMDEISLGSYTYNGLEKSIALEIGIKALEQEPCEDCISRQAVLEAFNLSEKTRKYGGDHSGYDTMMLYEIQDVLENLPPVQPIRPKGEWIKGEKSLQCPKCGAKGENIESDFIFNYCPCCGADMRGKADETDN